MGGLAKRTAVLATIAALAGCAQAEELQLGTGGTESSDTAFEMPSSDELNRGEVDKVDPVMTTGGMSAAVDPPEHEGTSTESVTPPLDRAPLTGTLPPVADLAERGPYEVETMQSTGPANGYTVYHPEPLAAGGEPNPIVSWGNGEFTTPADYPLLPHLASHGFVVVAANSARVTGADVRDGIDWILEAAGDPASPFHAKLDTGKVAGLGYANGGLATYEVADHPGLTTVVVISGANLTSEARAASMSKLHTPTAYLCTDDDPSEDSCRGDFEAAQVPAFLGVMNDSAYGAVTTRAELGDAVAIDCLNEATTAWLRWQLAADESLREMFLGADCGLCGDPRWTVFAPRGWAQ